VTRGGEFVWVQGARYRVYTRGDVGNWHAGIWGHSGPMQYASGCALVDNTEWGTGACSVVCLSPLSRDLVGSNGGCCASGVCVQGT
jgi:hypothetical protein